MLRRGRLVRAANGVPAHGSEPSPAAGDSAPGEAQLTNTRTDAERAWLAAALGEASARGRRLAREQDEVLSLARLLAERLVGAALDQDERALSRYALSLIDEARGARNITLCAHRDDAERLQRAFAAHDFDERDVRIVVDAALGPAEIRLETELGAVVASPAESLAQLARAARDELERLRR